MTTSTAPRQNGIVQPPGRPRTAGLDHHHTFSVKSVHFISLAGDRPSAPTGTCESRRHGIRQACGSRFRGCQALLRSGATASVFQRRE